jgi:hypothetical protein
MSSREAVSSSHAEFGVNGHVILIRGPARDLYGKFKISGGHHLIG